MSECEVPSHSSRESYADGNMESAEGIPSHIAVDVRGCLYEEDAVMAQGIAEFEASDNRKA